MNKSDIDREVALETGESIELTAITTALFLKKVMKALARGEDVLLQSFGKFKLAHQGGGPPIHMRFGTDNPKHGSYKRFRVHFSKSRGFSNEVRRQQKEKAHGEARRRRNG